MAFTQIELKNIERLVGRLCDRKSPPEIRNQLRFEYEVSGQNVHIWEIRPLHFDPTKESKIGIAKFRFIRSRNQWTLYWMRADLKWHAYQPDPSQSLSTLEEQVAEVERDPYCAFFG